jgi:tetratricopeptide (TPR) repeat protein
MRAVVGIMLGLAATLTLSCAQPGFSASEVSVKSLQSLAVKQLAHKDFKAAKETAEKLVAQQPSSSAAHLWLAKALYGLKEYKGAAQEYTAAFETANDAKTKSRLQFDRAQAEYFAQSYPEAISDFSALITAEPTNEDLYMQRASAYDASGKPDLAVADLSEAVKLHPASSEILLKRALLHKYMKKNDDALADFNQAIKLNPALATWRASFYRDQGQHTEAIQDFTTAIESNHGCGKAAELCNRAAVYADLDHHRKAIKDYSDAIKLEGGRHEFYANRGTSYYGVSDFKHSIADLGEAIKRAPQNPEYYFKRAEAETSDGQKQAALKDYEQAVHLQSNKKEAAQYNYRRALVAAELNNHQEALASMSSAIDEDPSNADYWFDRGLEYKSMDKWKEAESDFSKAIELRKGFATAYKHRALVRAKAGDDAGAVDDLKTSMQLYGEERDMHGLAECRRMMDKLTKS